MENQLTNAAFLTPMLWENAVKRCVDKKVHQGALLKICSPQWRAQCYEDIILGKHEISPARTLYINKKTGNFCKKYDVLADDRREVMMNDIKDKGGNVHGDRLLLMVAYILLCSVTKDMVHPRCKSYQHGLSCGKAVTEAVRLMKPYIKRMEKGKPIGIKIDLSKYFDRVPRRYIWQAFDRVEEKYGKDAMITMLRKYYALDKYYDSGDKVWVEGEKAYKSLKQGCPVAAWLANVVLYHIDDKLSKMDVYYVRYSDDILIIGPQWKEAYQVLVDELAKMDMTLNEKKLETLYANKRFVFLGFSILGEDISLSPKWVRHFKKEIDLRSWDMRDKKHNKHINPPRIKDNTSRKEHEARKKWRLRQAELSISKIKDFLYRGDGEHCWASQVLPYLTNEHDIKLMSEYMLDAVRSVITGCHQLGLLRYEPNCRDGALFRNKGISVLWNNRLTTDWFDDVVSISAARKAMHDMCKPLYDTITRASVYGDPILPPPNGDATIEDVECAYEEFKHSVPDGSRWGSAFQSLQVGDLTREDILSRLGRPTAYSRLLQVISNAHNNLTFEDGWYWQSKSMPDLIILNRWQPITNH